MTIIAKEYIEQREPVSYKRFHEIMTYLLRKGAKITDVDADGNSIWSVAVLYDDYALLEECFECFTLRFSIRTAERFLNDFLQQLASDCKRYAEKHNGAESEVLAKVVAKVKARIAKIEERASHLSEAQKDRLSETGALSAMH